MAVKQGWKSFNLLLALGGRTKKGGDCWRALTRRLDSDGNLLKSSGDVAASLLVHTAEVEVRDMCSRAIFHSKCRVVFRR